MNSYQTFLIALAAASLIMLVFAFLWACCLGYLLGPRREVHQYVVATVGSAILTALIIQDFNLIAMLALRL